VVNHPCGFVGTTSLYPWCLAGVFRSGETKLGFRHDTGDTNPGLHECPGEGRQVWRMRRGIGSKGRGDRYGSCYSNIDKRCMS